MSEACPHHERLERLEAKAARVEKILTGNGDTTTGLLFKVDRIGVYLKILTWVASVGTGAIIVAIVTAMAKLMGGG